MESITKEKPFDEEKDFIAYLNKRYKNKDLSNDEDCKLSNLIFNFDLEIPLKTDNDLNVSFQNFLSHFVYRFKRCEFNLNITVKTSDRQVFFEDNCKFNNHLKIKNRNSDLTFKNCVINDLDIKNVTFGDNSRKFKGGKIRFHSCEFHKTNFTNTKFNNLVDFWNSTFHNPITFHKTDFNDTTVFSAVRFKENILFTYTFFGSKTIFGRTIFEKGIDLSQGIIDGDLLFFDLKFNFPKYISEYVGKDNEKFQKYIDSENIIPHINKVTTFQILKNNFAKQGNHIDEVLMSKEEKTSFSELVQSRKEDQNWGDSTWGDRVILWLNRRSNNYKSDFRNGISFTLISSLLFLLLTFLSTEVFWGRICFSCEFDCSVIGYTVKQFIVFLNPTHKITYINELKPFLGIPYIFDLLGRIAVGYGIYQTIQAFRKYK